MASLASIPRFLLPRQSLLRQQPRLTKSLLPSPPTARHVSNARQLSAEFERRRAAAASTKQPVIPQPDKYRPPSHGKTLPRRADPGVGKVYGPKLTEDDKKRMATKKYPNMMSPEGTFSHWFFNNRWIHLWITMVRLHTIPRPRRLRSTNNRTGHTHLPRRGSLVHGLHVQNRLRTSRP